MKAKLNKDYTTHDGVLIPEGTEVQIANGYCTTEGYSYECVIPSGDQKLISSEAVTITDHTPWIDWNTIRTNAAISIAQGLAANSSLSSNGEDHIADKSVRLADKLVEKLKERM